MQRYIYSRVQPLTAVHRFFKPSQTNFLITMSSFSNNPTPTHRNKSKRDAIPSVSNNNGDPFLAMAPLLSSIDPNGSNVVYSPVSLRAMVSLIAAGASGPATEQLLSFLKSESVDQVNALSSNLVSKVLADTSSARGSKICFTNGLWIHKGLSLKHSFKQVVHNVYKADSFRVDFINKAGEIAPKVNSWVAAKTSGQIRKILDPDSVAKDARLILANALYFKGSWAEEYFKASNTEEHDFHLLSGESVKVPFMTSSKSTHLIGTYDGFKVLCLDYKNKIQETQFSMYILLPDSVDGLASLAERVASEPDFLDRHLSVKSEKVGEVLVPKLKISFGFRASETLKQLGVRLPFEVGGLTEMVDSPKEGELLVVSEIYQESFIEVNEEGTVASSGTRAKIKAGCPRIIHTVDFVADHPFMFLIREESSGTIMFFGHVLNPLN